ncbi:hypothetical protein CI238_09487 [Colletotrichum incanum]|uniref:Uncharacterized protein n=1 Tax=Colletotrichum incanum TaxID=1573173 RepID=A0A167AZV2_COLIC|nr:hypothetical protein CI238_09487 [Colletotrichum incanum]
MSAQNRQTHASLRFSVVHFAVQDDNPNGPIQQLDLCLHAEREPRSGFPTIHLLGDDASMQLSMPGTSVPIGNGTTERYMAVDDEEECCSYEGQIAAVMTPKEYSTRPNFIVDMGLIRLYLHTATSTILGRILASALGNMQKLRFPGRLPMRCAGDMARSVSFLPRRSLLRGPRRRSKQYNQHQSELCLRPCAVLLSYETLFRTPSNTVAFSMPLLGSESTSDVPSIVRPEAVLSSAGAFVPEHYFLDDVRLVLRSLPWNTATLVEMGGAAWGSHEMKRLFDRAKEQLFECLLLPSV